MADPADLAKQVAHVTKSVGDLQTAANIVWTLVAGFLVMFMPLGFALLETGLTRAKNVTHTMGMNIFVYAIGILCFWLCGFACQMGGVGALATFGGDASLSHEFVVNKDGKVNAIPAHNIPMVVTAASRDAARLSPARAER